MAEWLALMRGVILTLLGPSFCSLLSALPSLSFYTMGLDDFQWELQEDVPQIDDPFIQKYINGRNSLIQEEQKQRHG